MKNSLRIALKSIAGLFLLSVILWLGGLFDQPGISPGVVAAELPRSSPTHTGLAIVASRPIQYQAVGTLESVTRVQLTARIPGEILQLEVGVGDLVQRGDLLVVIDARDSTSRVTQARSALAAAEALAVQASAAAQRVRDLLAVEAATQEQLEGASANADAAVAGVAAAKERVKEAEIYLGYSRILAPMDGLVSLRPVEPGDMAWPGAPLLTLLDPAHLRIEAWVRESALPHVTVGNEYEVRIPSLGITRTAVVEDILPTADARSRSFRVRASIANSKDLHPGMFARLTLDIGQREIVEIEAEAVQRFGQLETTLVQFDSGWTRRYLTLGRTHGERVEVLSGLNGGETIGWGH